MRISLIGLPGSGKTTLATLLGSIFKTLPIQSGELARAHGFSGSREEKEGQLAPNEQEIRSLVRQAINGSNAYILDGFPRTIDQIEDLKIDLNAILYLEVGDYRIAVNRLLARGRPDDTLEIIDKRIKTYFKHTYPLVSYFDKKEILIRIDASGSIGNTLGQGVEELASKGLVEAKDYIKTVIKDLADIP